MRSIDSGKTLTPDNYYQSITRTTYVAFNNEEYFYYKVQAGIVHNNLTAGTHDNFHTVAISTMEAAVHYLFPDSGTPDRVFMLVRESMSGSFLLSENHE
ncbi:MAG: hypothetical protein LBV41_03855 [Cytophagaceae bacterium]|jgi:hypothetical protein|nr:hypothetical protein [Cytophagaceae bacterium]